MERMDYWSADTNPQTGVKFDRWRRALGTSHNGGTDIDALLDSEYGEEMAKLGELRFSFEEEPMGEACLNFYRSIGVKKELFTEGSFFDRWAVFTPLELTEGKKYPVVFWNHGGGNAIETDEFSTHITQMAGKEGFIACMVQNTNWETVDRVLDRILADYPADPERVYIVGYSQGGQTTQSAQMRIPERLAAVCPGGSDALTFWDNMDVRYTLAEAERLKAVFVPAMMIVGECEFLNIAPQNRYSPRTVWPGDPVDLNYYRHPDNIPRLDPSNPPGKRADVPFPPANTEPDRWKLERLNLRLAVQGCKPVDIDKCLSYRDTPEDELHHKIGFYGDKEETRNICGTDHYIIDCYNSEGVDAFRYVVIKDFPHWPSPIMGDLAWEYMKQFRRDKETGKIVVDEYKK